MGPVMCTSSWWAEGEVSAGDTKSGLIEELGAGVTNFARGEEVYARATVTRDGAKAENVVVQASDIAGKPRSLDHLHAAALEHVILTAWQGLIEEA
jgi:NADPH:quinone reductase-like Zn-dependent oxidoreductase